MESEFEEVAAIPEKGWKRSPFLDDLAEALKKAYPQTVKVRWSPRYPTIQSFSSSVKSGMILRLRVPVRVACRGDFAFVVVDVPDWKP